MNFLKEHIWIILFAIWGFPLSYYRSNFRKIVYQTANWTINIKPLFVKEIKGLFGNLYPTNKGFVKQPNFYRFYLGVYTILFLLYLKFS
jgi:peroxiredoxin Q/BCP